MKSLFVSLFALFLVCCVATPTARVLPDPKGKIYITYLVNESSHYAEYIIENADLGVDMYSGILPPKWASKNEMDSWDKMEKAPKNLAHVLKVEVHEDLLGTYKIHLRFLYTKEGAHTDGRWRTMNTYLVKEDFERSDRMFPYWEIHDDPVK